MPGADSIRHRPAPERTVAARTLMTIEALALLTDLGSPWTAVSRIADGEGSDSE